MMRVARTVGVVPRLPTAFRDERRARFQRAARIRACPVQGTQLPFSVALRFIDVVGAGNGEHPARVVHTG